MVVDRYCGDYSEGIIFDNIAELKPFWNKHYKSNFRLIYRPGHGDDEKLCNELDILSDWVYKCKNMTFLIEELNVIFDGQKLPKNLNTCIFLGRKKGVEIIALSQRPRGYGKSLLSQADVFNIFSTSEPDDLKYFREYLSDEAAEKIKNLKQYEYLEWDFRRLPDKRIRICKDEYIKAA